MLSPDDENLEKLVKRAAGGDAGAMSELMRITQQKLFRFCLFLCHDSPLAQDLMQDTYVRALSEIRKLKDARKFMSWLHQIARNRFLDHVKSPGNRPAAELDEEMVGELGEKEFGIHLREVLARLAPDDRVLLLLIDLEEYSYKEASEIIGISEASVRFRLHQIRKEFIKKYSQ
jgi:RNA polymerase sigma-70 factor, ECF subfamily